MYPMLVAIVIIAATSIPLVYLPAETNARYLVYPFVAVQGVGLAIMLNTATSLISDVIGSDAESSAFVYGVYSLFDKFSNGFLLFYIVATYPNDDEALRYIIGFAPIICAVLAYLLTFIGQKYFSHKLAKITGIR
jgi:MFS family permease